jgi:hypothetical protein
MIVDPKGVACDIPMTTARHILNQTHRKIDEMTDIITRTAIEDRVILCRTPVLRRRRRERGDIMCQCDETARHYRALASATLRDRLAASVQTRAARDITIRLHT